MSRGRKLSKNRFQGVPQGVANQMQPHFDALASQVQMEQTGNFGVLYPDGRPDIRQVRDIERASVQHLQDPHVYLTNPNQRAPFDKGQPQGRRAKNEAFGFQVQPDRIIDLPPGDAGAGKSVYRRTQTFARLSGAANVTDPVIGNPFNKAIGLATYVSSDCRQRFWHISFFGIGVQRVANEAVFQPLTQNQILSNQLRPNVVGGVDSVDYVPAVSLLQGRIMAFDESGQRFYDVDVIGNRSMDIYAWGVTAFILGPGNNGTDQGFYEVNRGSGGDLPQQGLSGLVEDALIGIRIVPIAINSTQNTENRTVTIVVPNDADSIIPIPPGALRVQAICRDGAAAAATFTLRFDTGNDGTAVMRTDVGILDINPGQSRSDLVLIPNASQIIIEPGGSPVSTGWSFIFEVEAQ